MFDHLFRNVEIGDNAIAQRPDRLNIAGGAPQHHLRLVANREHLLATLHLRNRNHGWFVQDNPSSFDIDQSVRRPEINGHICGQHAEKS